MNMKDTKLVKQVIKRQIEYYVYELKSWFAIITDVLKRYNIDIKHIYIYIYVYNEKKWKSVILEKAYKSSQDKFLVEAQKGHKKLYPLLQSKTKLTLEKYLTKLTHQETKAKVMLRTRILNLKNNRKG